MATGLEYTIHIVIIRCWYRSVNSTSCSTQMMNGLECYRLPPKYINIWHASKMVHGHWYDASLFTAKPSKPLVGPVSWYPTTLWASSTIYWVVRAANMRFDDLFSPIFLLIMWPISAVWSKSTPVWEANLSAPIPKLRIRSKLLAPSTITGRSTSLFSQSVNQANMRGHSGNRHKKV